MIGKHPQLSLECKVYNWVVMFYGSTCVALTSRMKDSYVAISNIYSICICSILSTMQERKVTK